MSLTSINVNNSSVTSVDNKPVENSDNLVKSGGVKEELNNLYEEKPNTINDESDADLNIGDENGNVVAEFAGGHIKTKNFDSRYIGNIFGNLNSSVRKQSTAAFDAITGIATVYEASGVGQIENMFFAGGGNNWHNPEQCTLNVYCDGILCISGKLYELACMNLDFAQKSDYNNLYFETYLFSKFGIENSINFDFKIPYYYSCKVELVQPTAGVTDEVWVYVRASSYVNISYGALRVPYGAYFKCIKKSENNIVAGNQYTLMESNKNSFIIGCNLFMNAGNVHSLEGCVRIFNTQSNTFKYLSSGLEDFFLGTYYFNTGMYQRQQAGLTYFINNENGCKMSAYRIFVNSPLCFNYPVKVTVRNGDSIIDNEMDPISDELIYSTGYASYGSFCFYYEW